MLLVRAGALGDVLLLRRAVAALCARGHAVTLLAPSPAASVLVGPGPAEVEAVLPWEGAETASLFQAQGPPPGCFRDRLSGFDAAIAYTRSLPLLESLRRLIPRVVAADPAPPPGTHASEWLARPALEAGGDPAARPSTHTALPHEREALRPWLATLGEAFVALHPGSGSPAKNWPAARFARLAAALADGRRWLLVEGPADAEAARIPAAVPGAVRARNLPPRILGALLAEAGIYVGNDSGVTHLAAAWGAPTLALFGPTEPDVWSPVGSRVRVLRAPAGRLDGLDVAEVREAARRPFT
jgi:ADP-heptose:LPS heptosyltransferase